MMGDLKREHMERHQARAQTTFAKHVVTKSSDLRWLLQRVNDDGRATWTWSCEVVVLEGGSIFVGGDIDHVIFSSGPADAIERLRWMGECDDLGYYVAQKARIGSGSDLVDAWDDDIAREELDSFLKRSGMEESDRDRMLDEMPTENRHEFLDWAWRNFSYEQMSEAVGDAGEVLAPRVIYAHAALARLCALLREAETQKAAEATP